MGGTSVAVSIITIMIISCSIRCVMMALVLDRFMRERSMRLSLRDDFFVTAGAGGWLRNGREEKLVEVMRPKVELLLLSSPF